MAYDAMAGYIYELNPDIFAKTIPETYQQFLDVLERAEVDTSTLALAIDCDDTSMLNLEETDEDEMMSDIFHVYDEVKRLFEAKTGLKICLTYVDEDSGSRYNDVFGGVWNVLNAVQPTEPARRLERFIDQKFFCIFG